MTLDFEKSNNSAFYDLFYNQKRYLVLKGGAGAGKSHFVAQKILYRCLTEGIKHKVLILRKTNKAVHDSCFALVNDYLNEWNIKHTTIRNNIKFNKCELIFTGLDDPMKIKSIEGVTGIWMEEATEFALHDFRQLDLRLRGEFGTYKQLILSFNPEGGKHSWIYKMFYERKNEKAFTHNSTWRDNKFIDKEYKELILSTDDETFISIYDKGEWAELKHAIISNYVIEDFNIKEILDSSDRIYCGLDFGFNDPSVCLLMAEKDRDVYMCAEIYVHKKVNKEFIELVKNEIPGWENVPMYADSAEPDRIQEFVYAGITCMKSNKSVKPGIDEMKSRKIVLHPNCTQACVEIPSYKYKVDSHGNVYDEPVKYKDHTCDAARYGIYTTKYNQVELIF